MEREADEGRHWEKMAWWLTGISLIPAMTVTILWAAGTEAKMTAYGVTASSIGAAAWLALLWNVLWASIGSCRAKTSGDKRNAALKTAWGFGAATLAMVGLTVLGMFWSNA